MDGRFYKIQNSVYLIQQTFFHCDSILDILQLYSSIMYKGYSAKLKKKKKKDSIWCNIIKKWVKSSIIRVFKYKYLYKVFELVIY
ncbi:hypothetical protein XELAEV_18047205mg [Xenopus laevis]|uniref:Uncharacterized protein n=1 Tax=Xenopus laevis TaxID=8355 RepID=A0A974BUJ6_XENLA|nr:hypothetical protein XELAEV_18047205mg [Xenopus laevis]